jgi:hypothetical protein
MSLGELVVSDVFLDGEALARQTSPGGVLTFTFAAPRDLVWVRVDGVPLAYADPFGGTPADGLGVPCEDGIPQPLTIRTSVVKVWAASGATVSVWGYSG